MKRFYDEYGYWYNSYENCFWVNDYDADSNIQRRLFRMSCNRERLNYWKEKKRG